MRKKEKEERVRWFLRRRCCCWDSPGYMLLFSRSVRTMYPLVFRRIPFQFGEWRGLQADAREGKSARVLLKSCWSPAAWAPGRDKKTTAYTLSHTHSTVKLSVMGYSRLLANGGKRGPSPVGDATAWEPMRFPEHRHGVAGGAGGVRPILMRLQHQLLGNWDL